MSELQYIRTVWNVAQHKDVRVQILQAFIEAKPVYDSSRSKAIQVLGILQFLLLPAPRRQVSKPCIQIYHCCIKPGAEYDARKRVMSAQIAYMW